ncbi:hypothetical protein QP028_06980 [Corynebacterium suedekumii]|nr:hypothetical protein QP028_06980 [Corynebacterium suedekumii]
MTPSSNPLTAASSTPPTRTPTSPTSSSRTSRRSARILHVEMPTDARVRRIVRDALDGIPH